jgi:hypothetical protein
MSKNDDFWLYHNGDKNNMPDLELPEDLIIEPEAQEEKPSQLIKDEVDVAFNFAFIGAGQGGSRIAETFHKIG